MGLIVTLTINPAIDRVISVDRLAFEDRAYIKSSGESPGGRGLNSSCVIHAFEGPTVAVLISGGESGKELEGLLSNCGFPVRIVPVANEIRTNFTITDKHGLTVNLNGAGPLLSKAETTRVESEVTAAMADASWLLLCGSLPPGVPDSFYGKLISVARQKKVKTLVRANGEALREAIDARPSVVALNQVEAGRLLGRTLLTRTHYLEAAERVRAMGPESVVLSLGSRGAVGAYPDGLLEAQPPAIDAVCPIGAGDALAAAYAWSMRIKGNHAEALRWGVAAGTASARLPGMQMASLAQTEEIYRKVEVRRAE
jgi:1-phosphofructokinase family hexose kinase